MSSPAFSPASYDEWRAEAEASLKGAPFNKKLLSELPEGITLQPIYNASDIQDVPHLDSLPGQAPYLRGNRAEGYKDRGWFIAQEIPAVSAKEFNSALRSDLQRGQNAVYLTLDRASRAGFDADQAPEADIGWGGVSIASLEDMVDALAGIELSAVPLYLRSGSATLTSFAMLVATLRHTRRDPVTLSGGMVADPVGELATQGRLSISLERAFAEIAAIVRWSGANAPLFRPVGIGTVRWHDAGATATQELAFAVATGVESLRRLLAEGLPLESVTDKFLLHMGVGSEFFVELCKFRAARVLWAKVTSTFGLSKPANIPIIARTSRWNKSLLDPYVNMLRTTTEAFSAVLGGVEALSVGGFDEIIRQPDEFSRRISRNTQIILGEECSLMEIIDPAGGAWYPEWLTHQLATKAWEIFQQIEATGGMAKAVLEGIPQSMVGDKQKAALDAVAKRRKVLVGVNLYANAAEKPLSRVLHDHLPAIRAKLRARVAEIRISSDHETEQAILERLAEVLSSKAENAVETAADAVLAGATLGELTRTLQAGQSPVKAPAIPVGRAAAEFEAVRAAAESHLSSTGRRPLVFLATMGPLAQHKARADFSRSFFEPGGFEVVSKGRYQTPEEAVADAAAVRPDVVVLCSTDETYPDLVPPLASGLKALSPAPVIVLAGWPAEHVEAFRAAGVDEFIHIRANVLQTLSAIQERLWGEELVVHPMS